MITLTPRVAGSAASFLQRRREQLKTIKTHTVSNIQRIVSLPISSDMSPDELEEFNKKHVMAQAFDSDWRLFPVQANALQAYKENGGLWAPIAVGFGKTLLTLMIANEAYQNGIERIMLLIPPQIQLQLTHKDLPWARHHTPITFPRHIVGGRSPKSRINLCRSGKKGLYIFPYSLLSTKDTVENLKAINPGLIICDEADWLGNPRSARTKRLLSFIKANEPQGVCLSGTITKKSIRDYWHIITWCLGKACPLPLNSSEATDWAQVLDAQGIVTQSTKRPLKPLMTWAQRNFKEEFTDDAAGYRKAYNLRLNTSPAVVSSGSAEIGTSLILENSEAGETNEELKRLVKDIEEAWLTPNGDEIEHAIHTYKWLYELSAGFYNELTWADPEEYAHRKKISVGESAEILNRAQEYHKKHQKYASALRKWLTNNTEVDADTPFLVGREMHVNGAKNVGSALYDLWRDWKDADFEGRPDRDSNAVRVCDFKIKAALKWAREAKRGLLWFHHKEIGKWLFEEFIEAGLQPLLCNAGKRSNASILDEKNKDRLIIASLTAHGTGKNLQHFQDQYFVQWPRSAKLAEQALGRTHRNGQLAASLTAFTNNTTSFDKMNFAACLVDALYIHQTTGNRQKLIYCDYATLPEQFPKEVLRERGFQFLED